MGESPAIITREDKSRVNISIWALLMQGNVLRKLVVSVSKIVALMTALWCTFLGGSLAIDGIAVLLNGFAQGFSGQLMRHLLLGGLSGAFAGIAMAIYSAYRRSPSSVEKSLLSSFFTLEGFKSIHFDTVFWAHVAIGGLVGWLVGFVTSASGAVSPLELLVGLRSELLTTALGTIVPAIYGGDGGGGWLAILIDLILCAIALFALGLLVGAVLGASTQLMLSALAGAAKGGIKEYIHLVLEEAGSPGVFHRSWPIALGAVRGAIVGIGVSALFMLATGLRFLELP